MPLQSRPNHERVAACSSDDSIQWDCVVVHGYGKSGTKRLLRIIDLSSRTHCRNEAPAVDGSPMQELTAPPGWWIALPDHQKLLDAKWDDAVRWCALRVGNRDRRAPVRKDHHHPLAWHLGLTRLLASRKIRRVARVIMPSWGPSEWLLPRCVSDRTTLSRAVPVFKINAAPGFATWVLHNRPSNKVVHIVRHPGAVMHSWSVRLLAHTGYDTVRGDNLERLRTISGLAPSWAERFGDIESMSAEEAEMWFWLYCTETTHHAGSGMDGYELVLDEHVVQDPTSEAQRLFHAIGLPWNRLVERQLAKRASGWKACTACWRDLIAPDQVPLIEKILDRSTVKGWWTKDQVVSRIDYSSH
jgi:hypothetical protein